MNPELVKALCAVYGLAKQNIDDFQTDGETGREVQLEQNEKDLETVLAFIDAIKYDEEGKQ